MTTRASAARGTTKELFDGRVRKWVKEWTPVSDDRKKSETALKLLKWIQTEEKTEQLSGPRHPRIRPVADPRNTPVAPRHKLKPKRSLVVSLKRLPSQPKAATSNPDEPTTTDGGGMMAIDMDDDVSQHQAGASSGPDRPTSTGPDPLTSGAPTPEVTSPPAPPALLSAPGRGGAGIGGGVPPAPSLQPLKLRLLGARLPSSDPPPPRVSAPEPPPQSTPPLENPQEATPMEL